MSAIKSARRILYSVLPLSFYLNIRRFVLFLRAFTEGRTNQKFASISLGVFRVDCEEGDAFRFYGSEYSELDFVRQGYLHGIDLGAVKNVIDAGAFPGVFSVYAARKIAPLGQVFAFEPDKRNRAYLGATIRLNKISNVKVMPFGLSNATQRVGFWADSSYRSSMMLDNKEKTVNSYIDVVSIDELYATGIIKDVGFIKMDIEGAEIQALEGASKYLSENDVALAIATYHVVDGRTTVEERVEAILRDLGYEVKTLIPPPFKSMLELLTFAHKPKIK